MHAAEARQILDSEMNFEQVFAILTNKNNVMVGFRPTAAEIEQFVTTQINVTIDFGPTAAEIEQIVTLIANVKRNM